MFGKLCTYLVREKERESRVQWGRDDGEYWAGERVCARVQSNKGVGCDEPGRERMSWNEYAVMGWRERESFPLARNPICCVNCWCTCTFVFSDLLMTQVFGHQHFPIEHNLNNMQCFPHLSTLYCLCHAFVHSTICLETCFASFSWFTIPLALVSSANWKIAFCSLVGILDAWGPSADHCETPRVTSVIPRRTVRCLSTKLSLPSLLRT